MIKFFLKKWVDRYRTADIKPMDFVILSYIALLGVLIIPFHRDVHHWFFYPLGHLLVALFLLEFIRAANQLQNRILHFIRTFYPIIFIALGFKELDALFTMIFPYWATKWVIKLDLVLFGTHPTVWVQKLFTPWLTELMNFFYAIFWFYIPLIGFSLYFAGKKRETFDFLFLTVFTYMVTFILFIVFPTEGAWIVLRKLHTVEPKGYFFLRLTHWVQSKACVQGGAMPSSHVSAAFTMTWAALRYRVRFGWIFILLSTGIACATVYCRYHHAVDSIFGIINGTILFFIGSHILNRWTLRHQTS